MNPTPVEEAKADLLRAKEERDRLAEQRAVAQRDERQADKAMLAAEDVDGQEFVTAFRRRELCRAKLEVLAPHLQLALDRVEDAMRTLARREAAEAAAAVPRVEKLRSGAEWEESGFQARGTEVAWEA